MRPPRIWLALAVVLLGHSSRAQSVEYSYVVDSGPIAAPAATSAITIGFLVEIPGTTALRLRFSDVELAGGAQLRVMSLQDGALQTHTSTTAAEWSNTSAYFNGDRVWVEVLARPSTGPSRVRLESVTAESSLPPAPSQCGSTDDRLPSTDPRVGRLQPGICTAFLVDHCSHALFTAGHCVAGSNLVEFNVPVSSVGGNLVHPSPSNQYAIDALSMRFTSGGVGADWAVFGCFANPNTGKTPFEAQQAAFALQTPPPFSAALSMRVTGFGTDLTPPDRNFAQQTHAGPYFALTNTVVEYQVDTTSGSSGSPVILESTGAVVAIHTNGGCDATASGSNAGTSIANPQLQSSLNTPQGVLSCTGTWSTYCTAQVNLSGCIPSIGAIGVPSASAIPGSFTIRAVNVRNQQSGMLFYGPGIANQAFLGGTLCVGSPLSRTAISVSSGNIGAPDCSGVHTFDMGALIASGLDPRLHAGATFCAQFWQRDPLGFPSATQLTDAIKFTLGP